MATSEHLPLAKFGFQQRKAEPESFGLWNTSTMASAPDTGTSNSTAVGYHDFHGPAPPRAPLAAL